MSFVRAKWIASFGMLALLAGCVSDGGYGGGGYYPGGYNPGGYNPGGYNQGPDFGRGVHISDARYFAPDGRSCDAKNAVRNQCEGRSCNVQAGNHLCGDPAHGVEKQLVIGYKCGQGRTEVTVRERKSVYLSCG